MKMTVRSLGDKVPRIAETAWVSEAAYVVGDVELDEGSSVWPGAVVRADFSSIYVGVNSVVEDNCVLHTGEPLRIGRDNIIGHSVVIHCKSIGSNCLIGNRAVLLDSAEIGDFCLVAAGSLVLGRTVVPDRSFVSGSPATIEPIPERYLQRLEGQARAGPERGYGALARRYKEAGL
jgi:carbonic anhydrase/acetyltransferase-like protein (isoleucine patch superfamily)